MKFENANDEWVFRMSCLLEREGLSGYFLEEMEKEYYKTFKRFDWNQIGHNSTHIFWARCGTDSNLEVDIKVLNTLTGGTSERSYTIEEADRLYLGHQ